MPLGDCWGWIRMDSTLEATMVAFSDADAEMKEQK
jgi:hypothetical protein